MAGTTTKLFAAFSTLGCGELEIEDVLALASSRSFAEVEIRTLGGTNDLLEYFRGRFASPGQLRELVAASGVRVASIDASVNAIYASAADRDWLLDIRSWVLASDAPRIRVFDGGQNGSDAELNSVKDLVEWWDHTNRAEGQAIELAIETHDALAKPDALKRLLTLAPTARILWDTHHTWKEGGQSPSETWRLLRGRTNHLHVKDSRSNGPIFAYVPPGHGDYPFAELLQVLAAGQFTGTVSLEWERHWFPELPPIGDALDGFEAVFRSLLN